MFAGSDVAVAGAAIGTARGTGAFRYCRKVHLIGVVWLYSAERFVDAINQEQKPTSPAMFKAE